LGNYEIIRQRLLKQGKALANQLRELNEERREKFGGIELEPLKQDRVRTEHACVPRDIVRVGDHFLFGYHVEMHLKSSTSIPDVFSLHRFVQGEDGTIDLSAADPAQACGGFLVDPVFVRDFAEMFEFYPAAHLLSFWADATKLLAVFQIGNTIDDHRVFRWSMGADSIPH